MVFSFSSRLKKTSNHELVSMILSKYITVTSCFFSNGTKMKIISEIQPPLTCTIVSVKNPAKNLHDINSYIFCIFCLGSRNSIPLLCSRGECGCPQGSLEPFTRWPNSISGQQAVKNRLVTSHCGCQQRTS